MQLAEVEPESELGARIQGGENAGDVLGQAVALPGVGIELTLPNSPPLMAVHLELEMSWSALRLAAAAASRSAICLGQQASHL